MSGGTEDLRKRAADVLSELVLANHSTAPQVYIIQAALRRVAEECADICKFKIDSQETHDAARACESCEDEIRARFGLSSPETPDTKTEGRS